MASIQYIGNAVRAQVRRAGQSTLTKSFSLKNYATLAEAEKEAKKWASKQEVEIDSGKRVGVHGKTGLTVGEAVDRYLKENQDMGKTGITVMGYLKKGMGRIVLAKMTDQDIVAYIQGRNFGAASGAVHFAFLRTLLKMAKIGWQYHVPDILDIARDRLTILKLIGKSKERERRPTEQEIKMLLEYEYDSKVPMADIIRFAIASAMRVSEITRIEHKTVTEAKSLDERATVIVTDRKHPTKKKGNHKEVPLLDEALDLIKKQPVLEFDGRVFPFRAQLVTNQFTQACKKLGIIDLHLHDLRHEGTSRLFEMGYKIEEVAKFTGHEDWKMLKRYTHLKSKDIRRLEVKPISELSTVPVPPHSTVSTSHFMDVETMKEFEEFKRFKKMQEMMAAQKAA